MAFRLKLAKLAMYLGMVGFALCWMIGWATESRVFSNPVFRKRSATRTALTWVKGHGYYLEPLTSAAFRISTDAISSVFLLALLGGAYVNYRKRKEQRSIISGLSKPRE